MPPLSAVWLPVLASVLACVVAGAGWIALLRFRCESGPEWLGLAFAAGSAWLGMIVLALGPVAGAASPAVLLGAQALPLAGALLLRRPVVGRELQAGWIGFLPCLAVVAVSLWLAAVRPVWNVDALTRWVLHGQWLHEYGSIIPGTIQDPIWTPTHPRYPPVVPALIGLDLGLGADRSFGVRPLFPFYLLALLALVFGYARRIVGRRVAPWIAAGFALTPCFFFVERSQSGGGTGGDAALADIPLSMFVTGLCALCLLALRAPHRAAAWLAAILGVGAALTKQEGVPIVALTLLTAFGLALLVRRSWPGRARVLLPAASAFALACAAWMLLTRELPVEEGEAYLSFGAVGHFFSGLGRLGEVLARTWRDVTAFGVWGPLWAVPLAAGVAWLFARKTPPQPAGARPDPHHGRACLLLACWLALDTAIVVAAYLISGWRDGQYRVLMNVSFTRLLMHHAPLAALMLCHLPRTSAAGSGEPAPAAARAAAQEAPAGGRDF